MVNETAAPAVTHQPERPDLRCANGECELYELKPEPDEVSPTPGAQPDRCASCGQPLEPFSKDAR